jgi:hypothetical protein
MKNQNKMIPKYYLNKTGKFVIENFNYSKPFANFFPGIAGKYGIPMWTFYVNRGQAISCFGTKGKAHAILEFFPANKAWQLVSTYGFRTFIKVSQNNKELFYEPFHNGYINLSYKISNLMCISSYDLTIEETNSTLGLVTKIEYFNIPNDNYAGLARVVTIKNTSRKAKRIQLLDGLPQIVPYGTTNLFLKQLGRTIEAWMHVDNLDNGVPYFKLTVDPTDRPEVIHIKEGNFYLGFLLDSGKAKIIKPVVDPECVFGPVTDFSLPREFLLAKNFQYPKEQIIDSKMPCSFLPLALTLPSRGEKSFYSVVGNTRSYEILTSCVKKITSPGYLAKKREENKSIIEKLQQDINTQSSCRGFDLYAKQTYLDNIMRGGYPEVFRFGKSRIVFYLYSRKHGDLERDYNRYLIQPTYFSQGNGNYRDINQNRRCDTWFNPEIKDENLVYFFNLLQADGFNPLIVKGASFIIKDETYLKTVLKDLVDKSHLEALASFLTNPFTPGDIILFIEEHNIKLHRPVDEVVKILLSHSIKTQEAEHEAEYKAGYWTDHWAYNLDLLDSYLGVYPENLKELIFDKKIFTFYDPPLTVKPRHEKYRLYDGKPRQLKSVAGCEEKAELINSRESQPNVARTQYGKGEIYQTTLINKLLCLLANKLASLDPFGVGIEMEANKPNWYDALNGLPALFGSSLCETLELKRLVIFIKEALQKTQVKNALVSEETHEFLLSLAILIKENLESQSKDKDYLYWDASYSLKEAYRQKTEFGFSGKELELDAKTLAEILERALIKLDAGINKAKDKQKYYSYFINEVAQYQKIDDYIKPTKFLQKKLPLFLEGQMHALRLVRDSLEAKAIYKATKASELFDEKLKMYKVTAPLESMPEEIGRCRVFTPGWLENESIWLHMEYKYLLEILKSGLCEEFYAEFKNTLIPFQDPQRYGRNILENSSFLVGSAFPDKKLHGTGYVARLSGSTAEFIQMWLVMNLGDRPFFLNDKNELNLAFKPKLAGWLFDKKGNYSFNFLSTIPVTYHNKKRKDTFGRAGVKPVKIVLRDKDNRPVEIPSDTIPSPYAEQIRSRQIKKIEIYLE